MSRQPYPYYGTPVPIEKSMMEIRNLIYKHGGEHIQWSEGRKEHLVQLKFSIRTRVEGTTMLLPIKMTASTKDKQERAVYRALFYFLKAKFSMITFGITTVEEEFLAYIMLQLPEGEVTVGEKTLNHIRKGQLPNIEPIFPALPAAKEGR